MFKWGEVIKSLSGAFKARMEKEHPDESAFDVFERKIKNKLDWDQDQFDAAINLIAYGYQELGDIVSDNDYSIPSQYLDTLYGTDIPEAIKLRDVDVTVEQLKTCMDNVPNVLRAILSQRQPSEGLRPRLQLIS